MSSSKSEAAQQYVVSRVERLIQNEDALNNVVNGMTLCDEYHLVRR
jgi:hypothetical protein